MTFPQQTWDSESLVWFAFGEEGELEEALYGTVVVNPSRPTLVENRSAMDSMYGIRAYRRSTGEYVVTKNNVMGNRVTVDRRTP